MRTGDGDVMYQSVYVVVGALVLSSFLFSTFRFALLGLFSAWFGTDLVPCRYVLEFRAVLWWCHDGSGEVYLHDASPAVLVLRRRTRLQDQCQQGRILAHGGGLQQHLRPIVLPRSIGSSFADRPEWRSL